MSNMNSYSSGGWGESPLRSAFDIGLDLEKAKQAMKNHITVAAVPMQIILESNPYLPKTRKQFRFPRSKKARIRRKWAKRPENFRDGPSDYAFLIGDRLYCDEKRVIRLLKKLQKYSKDISVRPPLPRLSYEDSTLGGSKVFVEEMTPLEADVELSRSAQKIIGTADFPLPEIKTPPAPPDYSYFLENVRMRFPFYGSNGGF